jgi:hypothetical protein
MDVLVNELVHQCGQRIIMNDDHPVRLADLHLDEDDHTAAVTLDAAIELLRAHDSMWARLARYGLCRLSAGGDIVGAWVKGDLVLLSDLLKKLGISEVQKAQRRVVCRLQSQMDETLRIDCTGPHSRHMVWISLSQAVDFMQRTHSNNKHVRDNLQSKICNKLSTRQ